MSSHFKLSAEDLEGLCEFNLTRFESTGEARVTLYYYGAPERVEALAERHGMTVEVDEARVTAGVGTFHTVTAVVEHEGIHVLAIGNRPVTAKRAEAVSAR